MAEKVQIVQLGVGNLGLLNRVGDIFDEPIRQERAQAFVQQRNHIMLLALIEAESESKAVGQVSGAVMHHPDKATELFIDDLGVDPAYQRRGIATNLVKRLAKLGRERGCEGLWVGTETDNAVAQAFYASLGLSRQVATIFDCSLDQFNFDS